MRIKEMSKLNETGRHQHSKGHEVQPCQCLRQPLVVACEPAKTSSPGETTLHYPTARQEHKPSLGPWQLHNFQSDALPFSSLRSLFTRVASVHIGQLHTMSGRFLNLLGQLLDLCSV